MGSSKLGSLFRSPIEHSTLNIKQDPERDPNLESYPCASHFHDKCNRQGEVAGYPAASMRGYPVHPSTMGWLRAVPATRSAFPGRVSDLGFAYHGR